MNDEWKILLKENTTFNIRLFKEQSKSKFLVIYREILLFPVIPFGQMLTHVRLKCEVMSTEESNKIHPDMYDTWHLTHQLSGPCFAVHCPKKVFIFNSQICFNHHLLLISMLLAKYIALDLIVKELVKLKFKSVNVYLLCPGEHGMSEFEGFGC